MSDLNAALGKVLDSVTEEGAPRVPGVVAMVTDRDRTVFEGAAGVRSLADGEPMTADTVFAIFSTTKAITGTTVPAVRRGGSARPRRAGPRIRSGTR